MAPARAVLLVIATARALTQKQFWARVEPVVAPLAAPDRLRAFASAHWGRIAGAPVRSALARGQACDAPFPGLRAAPWHAAEAFAWAAAVERGWRAVDGELEGYLRATDGAANWAVSETRLLADTAAFSRLALDDGGGRATAVGGGAFRETRRLLSRVPLAPRPIAINRQGPRSGLAPHTDNANFCLTAHLGLRTNRDCSYDVRGETRRWTAGRLLVADTSFVHSTRNDSDDDRYVLSFAVWHPDLTDEERAGVVALHDALRELER